MLMKKRTLIGLAVICAFCFSAVSCDHESASGTYPDAVPSVTDISTSNVTETPSVTAAPTDTPSPEPSTTNTSELQSENVKQTDDKTETKDDVETNITNDTTQKSDNLLENELVDDTTTNNK